MRYLQMIVEVPNDVSIKAAREYIRTELKAAGGMRHPSDPLFSGLSAIKLKSVRLNAKTRKKRIVDHRSSD